MGIDLSHPDELDWMARGRRGEITASRFSESVSDADLEVEAEQRLVECICRRLVEGDVGDAHDCEDVSDELRALVQHVLSEVGEERRKRIEADVWKTLDVDHETDFFDTYEKLVADCVLSVYVTDRITSDAPTTESQDSSVDPLLVNRLNEEASVR